MTREEAMEQLKFMVEQKPKEPPAECDYIEEWYDTDKDIRNALDMAIKALEQEPSEDCVSRQVVTDAVENTIAKYIPIFIGRYEKIPLELARAIKDVPPVTPTSKKGKWILHEKSISTGFKDLRECSCCKCYFDWLMPRNSYCPNCGAEMESE